MPDANTVKKRPKVELVYFEGCPNVDEARTNLRQALEALELPSDWKEWVQGADRSPNWAEGLPSPTVLVDGRDVTGPSPEAGAPGSCAVGGAPGPELLRKAIARTPGA